MNVIHAHKPAILRIRHREPPTIPLIFRMRASHIVRNRPQVASLGQIQRPLLVRHHVPPDQQPPILHAVDVLRHLALPAAARPLVHQDQLILIRRHHRHRSAVVGRPTLPLANVQQHRVDALLRARPRIKVVGKNLLVRRRPFVDYHLPPAKVRMPERRSHKQHTARHREIRRNPAPRNHPLQISQRRRKKRRLPRHNQQRSIPQRIRPGVERHRHQFLRFQPVQRLLPRLFEPLAKPLFIRRLVRRQMVPNHHRVWVPPPHRRIGKVDRQPVPRLRNHRLHNASHAARLKYRLILPVVVAIAQSPVRIPRRPAQRPIQQLLPRLRRLHQRRRA